MPAVMKIRDEMAENDKHTYVQVIGDYLLRYLEQHPDSAKKILAKDKTIKGSLGAMKAEAQKNQIDGCGVLTDEEGYALVRKYFGLTDKPEAAPVTAPARPSTAFDVDLDELLGLPRG